MLYVRQLVETVNKLREDEKIGFNVIRSVCKIKPLWFSSLCTLPSVLPEQTDMTIFQRDNVKESKEVSRYWLGIPL